MKQLLIRHREKINYLAVGAWNTVFGYSLFVALYFLLGQNIHYLVLLIVSNILSITNAYVGYKLFVFKTKGNYLQEYLRFYVVYGTALVLNFVLLPVCVEIFKVSPPLAQAGLLGLNIIFSYLGHKNYSFGVA